MGINYDLQSQAKSSAGVTQMFAGTYKGDLGWPWWSELKYVPPPHSAQGSGLCRHAALRALLGAVGAEGHWQVWGIVCAIPFSVGVAKLKALPGERSLEVTCQSVSQHGVCFCVFCLLVQENYAADGVIINSGRVEAEK